MPVYAYECFKCGAEWDEDHCIAEREQHGPCPNCGAHEGRLLITRGHPYRENKDRRLISEGQAAAEYGAGWRETPGSIRMIRGESERTYFGAKGGAK